MREARDHRDNVADMLESAAKVIEFTRRGREEAA